MATGIVEVSDNNFETEVLKSTTPVLVDFWAPWCGPCLALGPVLEELASEYGGKVKIAKMNVDDNPNTPAQFGVRSIPFLVMMKNGQVVSTQLGAMPKNRLKDMIDRTL